MVKFLNNQQHQSVFNSSRHRTESLSVSVIWPGGHTSSVRGRVPARTSNPHLPTGGAFWPPFTQQWVPSDPIYITGGAPWPPINKEVVILVESPIRHIVWNVYCLLLYGVFNCWKLLLTKLISVVCPVPNIYLDLWTEISSITSKWTS